MMRTAILGSVLIATAAASAGAQPPAEWLRDDWKTDFDKHTVPFEEIVGGGPPKDGIPPIDSPRFTSVEAADDWLDDRELVMVVEHAGEVRVYPIQILMYHEIVNDRIGDLPVAVTYCPLCNTAITFDRRFDGRVLDFGTTGKLRHSDLVMYDRQTETWWQQASGEGLVGEYAGSVWTMAGTAETGPLSGERLDAVVHGDFFWFAWAVFKPETRIWRP